MTITNIPQDNIHHFPHKGADTACAEVDPACLQDECLAVQTIIKLLRPIAQGEEHAGSRAWLMEEMEELLGTINKTLAGVVVVRDPGRDPGGSYSCALDLDGSARSRLGAIENLVEVLNNTIYEDRYNGLRIGLIAHLHEEFSKLDHILDCATLRPRPPQHGAH